MLTWTLKNTLFLAMECIIVGKTRMLRCILGVFASLEGPPLGAWIAECMHFYMLLEPCLTECMHFCVLLTRPGGHSGLWDEPWGEARESSF